MCRMQLTGVRVRGRVGARTREHVHVHAHERVSHHNDRLLLITNVACRYYCLLIELLLLFTSAN